MLTKLKSPGLKKKILKMYIDGKSQKQIFEELKDRTELNDKKLQSLIKENAFLSPKNFRFGSLLVFFVSYLTPVFAIYMRGYEYENLIKPVFILSLILSAPFLIFAILFYYSKDLQRIQNIGLAFLIYYAIFLVTFASIAADIQVWTIILFPLVIFPTMLIEWFKLREMIQEVRSKSLS